MLDAIIRFSLTHRLLVTAASALVLVFGAITLRDLPIDVFPDLNRPVVTILTEGHGMAPEEVETLITLPLENTLNGIPGVERVRSQTGIGLSVVYVEFDWGTDIYRNRQLVSEKLTRAKEGLPKDVVPIMGPVTSIMGQIQMIALYPTESETKVSPLEIRTLAEWVIRPRLLTIPGVSQIISIGGGLKQYQILVSAEKLNRFQIPLHQLDEELQQISQNTTGGFLEKDKQEYLVRNIGVVTSIEDLEQTVVGLHFGRPVLLKEIAKIQEGPRIKRGDGSFNGKPAVIISIQKQPGGDTTQITQQVIQAIEELKPSLPAGVGVNPDIFKQSDFIQTAIQGIQSKLKFGTVLVFLVLLVFLANLRMSIVTMTAIPFSFLVTAVVFKIFGFSVNTMTLGGLAIAIGELVDDSIVDVENVFRRLRENAKSAHPRSILKVVYEASSEVRNSIVLATLIIALVFIPLLNLGGLEGRLFLPLAFAYLTALFASLVVSLTITPVLCSYLFSSGRSLIHEDTRLVQWLKQLDQKVLEWALPKPRLVVGSATLLLIISGFLFFRMGKDFLPKFNEGTAMISVAAPASVSLTESNALGKKAEELILKIPEVKSVTRRTGRAEMDEHAEGVNMSEIDVDFKEGGRPREEVLNEIRKNLQEVPNVLVNVGQPISHRIDHMMSGVPSQIAIKVFGTDLQTLREKGQEIQNSLSTVPGLVDLKLEQQTPVPQAKIFILREQAAKFGLSAGEVTHLLESAFNGDIVAQIIEEQRIFDVYFRFDDVSRGTLEAMGETIIKVMPDGSKVKVNQVADIYEAQGPNQINREGGQRRMVVSANVSGRDLGTVVEEIKTRIKAEVQLPTGYYVVYGGQFESQQSASKKIYGYGLLALLAIALVLITHFGSKWITGQIMLSIPFAFIGGVFLLYLTERTVSVASLVGFVTLCGIASRNGIMMISHYLHLMAHEGEGFTKEMVIRGSQERLIPVLMTALTASLALLPLVFAGGQSGSEILHPVAVVVVGGMFTATLLDFVVTPTVFWNFGRKSALKAIQPRETDL
jgi:CzcA family heavy metal efflux pump